MLESAVRHSNLDQMLNVDRVPEYTEMFGLHAEQDGFLQNLKTFVDAIRESGKEEAAIVAFVEYLKHHPNLGDAHLQLGYLLKEIGEKEHAILAFDNVLRLSPNNLAAILFKAEILIQSGEKQQARNLISGAEFTRPCNPETLYDLLRLNSMLGSVEDALAFAGKAIESTACFSAKLLNHLGNLHFRLNDFVNAERYFAEANRVDPQYVDARTNLDLVRTLCSDKPLPLFLVLPRGENYGWGVCSKYLRKELSKKIDVFSLEYEDWLENGNKQIPGVVFTSIGAESLDLIYPVKGKVNIGYTFFERDLTEQARQNAAFFDLVLAGSSWAVERLQEHGIHNTDVLVQGIDDTLFYPVERNEHTGFFVFSGGKFELRKSQDLVLKAIQILQQKYHDIILVNAWVNFWPASMATMSYSPHIRYEYREGEWEDTMNHVYKINQIDPSRVITCNIVPHENLRELFGKTDIGVFPNRSEGGTNLVLMEYMACGKPVIASNCTGHKDIINSSNSLPLENLGVREYRDAQGQHYATWDEPDLDELVSKLEYAYLNRDEIERMGDQAGEHMKKFTWSHMADNLIKILQKWKYL